MLVKLGLPLLQLLDVSNMFQCLPLLEGRVHISEHVYFAVGMGYKKNNWFVKGGWLSIFVEFM